MQLIMYCFIRSLVERTKFTEWFITKYKWGQLTVSLAGGEDKWEFVLLNFTKWFITKYKWGQLTAVADRWRGQIGICFTKVYRMVYH